MSKILRRPMFRGGGKVSSYGNGIATGLADGGMPDKRGLVDGPGGYGGLTLAEQRAKLAYQKPGAQKYTDTFLEDRLNQYKNNLYTKDIPNLDIAYGMQMVPPMTDEQLAQAKYFEETPEKFTKDFYSGKLDGINYNKLQSDQLAAATLAGEQDLYKILNKETAKNNKSQPDISAREAELESYFAARNNKKSAKEQIAENKKIFEEAMGGGKKAMIEDLSNMGLSYAAGALKEGATVKSSFADFFEKESQRPSRKSKVSDAASQAAITAYLTGEKSFRDFENMLALNKAKVKDTIDIKEEYAKNLNITDRFATAKASGIDGKKAKYDFSIKSWMNDNKDSIDFKSGNVNYFKEEDVKVTEENVGEIFVDLDKNLIFMIVLESGVPKKKFLR